ncbi:MAG TPA: MFS transporter [Kofleriaceae bacterium]|nr:MFS transporter [Kofleriaceae bacterium]
MSRDPIPRPVWLLGGVSFFADVSSEMIYPLLPLFIVAVLGASATSMGWIEGTAQAVVALITAYAGTRSDRYRRRLPWVRWGYGLPVLGKSILAVATTWPLVLLGRNVDRVGKGFRSSPRDALIADATPEAMRGRAFGLHRAMDTAGALVGSLLAAFLLWRLSGNRGDARPYRIIFVISAGMGVAAVALTFLIREAPRDQPIESTAAGKLALPSTYWVVLMMLLVFAIANSSDTFLLLRAADVGLSPWVVVLAYSMYNAVYTLGSYPAGAISDRIGRWRVIAIGWAVYAVVYAGFAVADSTSVWPLFAFYGLYMALTDGVGKALIADHAPPEHRGRALGIFYLATGATTIISSVAAGLLWDRVGPAAPFWLGAGAAVVAVAILPFVVRRAALTR